MDRTGTDAHHMLVKEFQELGSLFLQLCVKFDKLDLASIDLISHVSFICQSGSCLVGGPKVADFEYDSPFRIIQDSIRTKVESIDYAGESNLKTILVRETTRIPPFFFRCN